MRMTSFPDLNSTRMLVARLTLTAQLGGFSSFTLKSSLRTHGLGFRPTSDLNSFFMLLTERDVIPQPGRW